MLSFEIFFFFKQNTAYEMRISDWSSDVCSSDLLQHLLIGDFIDLPRLRNDAWIGGVDAVDIGEDVAAVGVQCGGERNRRRIGTAAAERRDPVSRRQSMKAGDEIGRASCRERVCQYLSFSVVSVSLKKK